MKQHDEILIEQILDTDSGLAQTLRAAGINTVADLCAATRGFVHAPDGIELGRVLGVFATARNLTESQEAAARPSPKLRELSPTEIAHAKKRWGALLLDSVEAADDPDVQAFLKERGLRALGSYLAATRGLTISSTENSSPLFAALEELDDWLRSLVPEFVLKFFGEPADKGYRLGLHRASDVDGSKNDMGA